MSDAKTDNLFAETDRQQIELQATGALAFLLWVISLSCTAIAPVLVIAVWRHFL